MPRFSVVGRLKVNVNVTVAGCEDATMLGRVKTDNGRFSLLQLEGDLNLLMHFHVVWSVADAIHNMDLNEPFRVRPRGRVAAYLHRDRLRQRPSERSSQGPRRSGRPLESGPDARAEPQPPRTTELPSRSFGSPRRCHQMRLVQAPVGYPQSSPRPEAAQSGRCHRDVVGLPGSSNPAPPRAFRS